MPDRDDEVSAAQPRKKRGRSYQMTLEFSTTDEPRARALMQRLIGVVITGGATMREFGFADVTGGKYRTIAEHKEQLRGRPRRPL